MAHSAEVQEGVARLVNTGLIMSPEPVKRKSKVEELKILEAYKLTDTVPSGKLILKNVYNVGGLLGNGGFGQVFAGIRKEDGELVAIKYVPKRNIADWDTNDAGIRIPMEVSMHLRCRDIKGVLPMIDFYETDDAYLIFTKRAENAQDLFDYITGRKYVSEREARLIFRQVVETVKRVMEKGVFHRDIKDENLIVQTDGQVFLIDFGSSTPYRPTYLHTTFSGTKVYSPPEWLNKGGYYADPATVWSLGCLLYDLVVGDIPFRDEHEIKLGTFKFPFHISPAVKDLIRWCLNFDPALRPLVYEIIGHPWLQSSMPAKYIELSECQQHRAKHIPCRRPSRASNLPQEDTDEEDLAYGEQFDDDYYEEDDGEQELAEQNVEQSRLSAEANEGNCEAAQLDGSNGEANEQPSQLSVETDEENAEEQASIFMVAIEGTNGPAGEPNVQVTVAGSREEAALLLLGFANGCENGQSDLMNAEETTDSSDGRHADLIENANLGDRDSINQSSQEEIIDVGTEVHPVLLKNSSGEENYPPRKWNERFEIDSKTGAASFVKFYNDFDDEPIMFTAKETTMVDYWEQAGADSNVGLNKDDEPVAEHEVFMSWDVDFMVAQEIVVPAESGHARMNMCIAYIEQARNVVPIDNVPFFKKPFGTESDVRTNLEPQSRSGSRLPHQIFRVPNCMNLTLLIKEESNDEEDWVQVESPSSPSTPKRVRFFLDTPEESENEEDTSDVRCNFSLSKVSSDSDFEILEYIANDREKSEDNASCNISYNSSLNVDINSNGKDSELEGAGDLTPLNGSNFGSGDGPNLGEIRNGPSFEIGQNYGSWAAASEMEQQTVPDPVIPEQGMAVSTAGDLPISFFYPVPDLCEADETGTIQDESASSYVPLPIRVFQNAASEALGNPSSSTAPNGNQNPLSQTNGNQNPIEQPNGNQTSAKSAQPAAGPGLYYHGCRPMPYLATSPLPQPTRVAYKWPRPTVLMRFGRRFFPTTASTHSPSTTRPSSQAQASSY